MSSNSQFMLGDLARTCKCQVSVCVCVYGGGGSLKPTFFPLKSSNYELYVFQVVSLLALLIRFGYASRKLPGDIHLVLNYEVSLKEAKHHTLTYTYSHSNKKLTSQTELKLVHGPRKLVQTFTNRKQTNPRR